MKSVIARSSLTLVIVMPLLLFHSQTVFAEDEVLGTVHFPVSCSPDVQADFNRAVGLLHHMMYAEARKAFEEIVKKDPGCPMAHWGVAMTLFQPLWPARPGLQDIKRGRETIETAKWLAPASERERAFVAAAEAFYQEPETAGWWTRIQRWEKGMEEAYRARPDDIETAAFYALSHLAAGYVAENRIAHHDRAAEILLKINKRDTRHPGAIHYLIHANDVTQRAGKNLDVVRSYGDIAPDVPHALHMPSHIFLRLGDWAEVIDWNLRSTAAALRFAEGHTVLHCGHYPHNPSYLLYAYLQRGEDQEARKVLDEVRKIVLARDVYQQEFVCAFHLSAMPARYAVERKAWSEAASLTPRSPASLAWNRYPWAEAITWFAWGLGSLNIGDLTNARKAERRMRELRDRAETLGEPTWVTYIEIDRRILEGWIAYIDGESERALSLIRSATVLEGTVEKDPVTPGAVLPSQEALGDLLVKLGQPDQALEAYTTSLELWPRRFNTLLGAARAARSAGAFKEARAYYSELLDVVSGTGMTRPGAREAKGFLAETQR